MGLATRFGAFAGGFEGLTYLGIADLRQIHQDSAVAKITSTITRNRLSISLLVEGRDSRRKRLVILTPKTNVYFQRLVVARKRNRKHPEGLFI